MNYNHFNLLYKKQTRNSSQKEQTTQNNYKWSFKKRLNNCRFDRNLQNHDDFMPFNQQLYGGPYQSQQQQQRQNIIKVGCPMTWFRKNILRQKPKEPPLVPLEDPTQQTTKDLIDNAFKTFTLQDVQGHNTVNDCWVTIQGKVYDITQFIPKHPDDQIKQECGTDANNMFFKQRWHGDYHLAIIKKFCVGELEVEQEAEEVPEELEEEEIELGLGNTATATV